mmetsp:Transcript_2770/g.6366  ORF Transcript_2770/g.6366 Transcript_2770/m.6366 type:complete len:253 (-) Transcript_2770:278-1036(-)
MHSMDSAAGRHSPTTLGHRWARNTRSLGHLDKAEKSQSKTQPETSTTCNGESGTPKVEISASSLLSIKLKYTIWDHGRKSATSRNPQWFNITLLLVSNSGQLVATHNNVAGSTRLPFFWRHHTLASNSPGAAQEKKTHHMLLLGLANQSDTRRFSQRQPLSVRDCKNRLRVWSLRLRQKQPKTVKRWWKIEAQIVLHNLLGLLATCNLERQDGWQRCFFLRNASIKGSPCRNLHWRYHPRGPSRRLTPQPPR